MAPDFWKLLLGQFSKFRSSFFGSPKNCSHGKGMWDSSDGTATLTTTHSNWRLTATITAGFQTGVRLQLLFEDPEVA